MTSELVWIIARSTATASLVALTLSVLSGMALRSGALGWLSHNRGIRALHDFASLIWLPLATAHILAILADPYAKVGVLDLIVPFRVSYGRAAVGLGTIAAQLFSVVLVSTWLRARLSQRRWLLLHRLSYVAFVATFAHGLLSGTDFAQPLIAASAWVVALALCLAGLRRLTTARRQSPARSRTVAIP